MNHPVDYVSPKQCITSLNKCSLPPTETFAMCGIPIDHGYRIV